jgi:putative hydrolase of the HAD superfamily
MIRAIVFDFGNVVGFFDHRLVTQRLIPHGECDAENFHSSVFGGELADAYESGRIGSDEFVRRVRELGRLRCSNEIVMAAYADIFWPNPDVAALLPRLKPQYTLLLASNTSELHSKQFRRQFADTLKHFDALVLSHEIGARKPTAAFFDHCRQKAGVPADECAFIDDLPANVEGARACGWHGIVYTGIADLLSHLAEIGVSLPSADSQDVH